MMLHLKQNNNVQTLPFRDNEALFKVSVLFYISLYHNEPVEKGKQTMTFVRYLKTHVGHNLGKPRNVTSMTRTVHTQNVSPL